MMTTINITLKYLFIDKVRRYSRAVKDNIALTIGGVIAVILGIAFGVDALKSNSSTISAFFPYVIAAYAAYKALQDYPMATIPYPMLTQRIFRHNTLISYFLVKSVVPTALFLLVWMLLGLEISKMFVVSLLLNIAANVYTAYKPQATSRGIATTTVLTLTVSALAILFVQPVLACFAAAIPSIALLRIRSLTYDFIFPYYESLFKIKTGFETKDSSMMAAGQSSFIRAAQKSTTKLASDGYGKFFSLRIELVRLAFRKKSLIVCSSIILCAGVLLATHFNYDLLVHLAMTMLLFLIVDMYLLALDRGEKHVGTTNPLLATSTRSKLRRNYWPHLLLTVFFFVLGLPILIGLNPALVVVAIVLLPLQSILVSNASGIKKMAIAYLAMMVAFVALIASVDPGGMEVGKLIQQMQGR